MGFKPGFKPGCMSCFRGQGNNGSAAVACSSKPHSRVFAQELPVGPAGDVSTLGKQTNKENKNATGRISRAFFRGSGQPAQTKTLAQTEKNRAPLPVYVLKFGAPVPYARAWRWQQELVSERIQRRDEHNDALFLLQHTPVYTLGRGATEENLKFDPESGDHELHRVERGGEVPANEVLTRCRFFFFFFWSISYGHVLIPAVIFLPTLLLR